MVLAWLRPAGSMELMGLVLRPRCWIRGRHRWRVPTLALLAECSGLAVRVRCADCRCQRSVAGSEIQRHRLPGL
jgi:hypothetical protein